MASIDPGATEACWETLSSSSTEAHRDRPVPAPTPLLLFPRSPCGHGASPAHPPSSPPTSSHIQAALPASEPATILPQSSAEPMYFGVVWALSCSAIDKLLFLFQQQFFIESPNVSLETLTYNFQANNFVF